MKSSYFILLNIQLFHNPSCVFSPLLPYAFTRQFNDNCIKTAFIQLFNLKESLINLRSVNINKKWMSVSNLITAEAHQRLHMTVTFCYYHVCICFVNITQYIGYFLSFLIIMCDNNAAFVFHIFLYCAVRSS